MPRSRNNEPDDDQDDFPSKHIRLMLTPTEHHALRVLAAMAGESMFQHARSIIVQHIAANAPVQRR